MGAEAVPFLVGRMEDAPLKILMEVFEWFSETPSRIFQQRKEMWQGRAAFLLGEMGSHASEAELVLGTVQKSPNWYLQGAAKVALMKINQESPDTLIAKLSDTSDSTSWYRTTR